MIFDWEIASQQGWEKGENDEKEWADKTQDNAQTNRQICGKTEGMSLERIIIIWINNKFYSLLNKQMTLYSASI